MAMYFISDPYWATASNRNSGFAFLCRLEIPGDVLKFGMFDNFRSSKRHPSGLLADIDVRYEHECSFTS